MSYTSLAPLRRSTAWSQYPEDYVLPVVYGRVVMHPRPYDNSGALWFIADHPVQSVDFVVVDGTEITSFALQNGVDDTGRAVAVLELGTPVDNADKIRMSVRGKMDADSGQLLDRPDTVLHDWLANVCGMGFSKSDFDALRAWAQTNSVIVGGVIDKEASIQSITDSMASGMGLAWNPLMRGVAMPWPPESVSDATLLKNSNISNAGAILSIDDQANDVTVDYALVPADGKPARSVTARANGLGERRRTVQAHWLQSPRAAEALALRLSAWYGAGTLQASLSVIGDVQVGDAVSIRHPHIPDMDGVVIESVAGDVETDIQVMAAAGSGFDVDIIARSTSVDMDVSGQRQYAYENGLLTYRVIDENGRPIARAKVTVGSLVRLTDGNGYVQFKLDPGDYMLKIEAAGYVEQTVFVSL